ncbi:MAG: RyR domain-containing protein, partial [Rhizobiaceae bacterium]
EITNIELALELKKASQRLEKLSVPTFVFSERKSALDQFMRRMERGGTAPTKWLKKISPASSQNEILEPFGRSDEVCNWSNQDTERELLAKQLHENYLEKRMADGDQEFERSQANQPWHLLSETYKNANRIAADHFSMLAFSNDHLKIASGEEKMEALAALEHDAWWIDRELDGWHFAGERDNNRKHHPNLVPYSQLTEEIKDYDRAQVKSLIGELL